MPHSTNRFQLFLPFSLALLRFITLPITLPTHPAAVDQATYLALIEEHSFDTEYSIDHPPTRTEYYAPSNSEGARIIQAHIIGHTIDIDNDEVKRAVEEKLIFTRPMLYDEFRDDPQWAEISARLAAMRTTLPEPRE